jgi:hypothetical protein
VDRFSQQRQDAGAGRRAEEVDNGGQNRERRTHAEREEGHCYHAEVLDGEQRHCNHEHNDDDQVDPAHDSTVLKLEGRTAGSGQSSN